MGKKSRGFLVVLVQAGWTEQQKGLLFRKAPPPRVVLGITAYLLITDGSAGDLGSWFSDKIELCKVRNDATFCT